ncbi:hypothetical protein B5180_39745, partial [Streptomyces sp. BF-3]
PDSARVRRLIRNRNALSRPSKRCRTGPEERLLEGDTGTGNRTGPPGGTHARSPHCHPFRRERCALSPLGPRTADGRRGARRRDGRVVRGRRQRRVHERAGRGRRAGGG